jgi:hypothetical protein
LYPSCGVLCCCDLPCFLRFLVLFSPQPVHVRRLAMSSQGSPRTSPRRVRLLCYISSPHSYNCC